MRERLIYLGKVYVITIVVFVIAKVVFMVANYEGHAFGVGDVWDVVRHGIGLDLSTGSAVFGDDGECVVAIEGAGDGDEGVLWGDRDCDDAGIYGRYEPISVLGI